jgi:hypothetical protein
MPGMRAKAIDINRRPFQIRAAEGKGRQGMEFMQSGPDIVRSDYQRWLLDYWASQRGPDSLPIWRGLNAADLAIPFDNLAWMDVVGDREEAPRFLIRFHGRRLSEAVAPIGDEGKFIDDLLPPPYLGAAVATYREVVRTKGPVYTVSDMRDLAGRIVHHERLLLPFSLDGTEVERILASIEAGSPEGQFELRDLLKSPTRLPVIALCATIQY